MRNKEGTEAIGPVCGLDLSLTSTGLAVLSPSGELMRSENVRVKGSFPDTPEGETRRLTAIADAVAEGVPPGCVAVNIEALAFASNQSGHAANVGLHHMVRERLLDRFPVCLTAPTTLKKFVSGDGRSQKDLMLMHVLDRWGERLANGDQADAYGLARLALMAAGMEEPKGKYEIETVNKLRAQLSHGG